jgi:hypothetical protein
MLCDVVIQDNFLMFNLSILAQVYTLCHKEGHSYAGLFSKGYNDSILLRNVFNYWIGMFYGVLPATFACKL